MMVSNGNLVEPRRVRHIGCLCIQYDDRKNRFSRNNLKNNFHKNNRLLTNSRL